MVTSKIDEARRLLPLPDLLSRLGFGDHSKRSAKCPFHEDSTPSFSVYQAPNGRWKWKCFAKCGHGDEIDFVIRTTGFDKKAAIRYYLELAGIKMTKPEFAEKAIAILEDPVPGAKPIVLGILRNLTPNELRKINKWRGYKSNLLAELAVVYDKTLAFPVVNGYHYLVKGHGWRYSPGSKPNLFQIGEIEEGAGINVFESQWDAIAYADVTGDRTNIVATRGASNTAVVRRRFKDHTGTLYLWPQNDEPGQKWARDIATASPDFPLTAPYQVRVCPVPPSFKDFNDWTKAGALVSDIHFAMNVQSTDLSVPIVSAEQRNVPGPVVHDDPDQARSIVSEASQPDGGQSISQTVPGESQVETPALPAPLCLNQNEKRNAATETGTTLEAKDQRPVVPIVVKHERQFSTSIISEKSPTLTETLSKGLEQKLTPKSDNALSSAPTATVLGLGTLDNALTAIEKFLLTYIRFEDEWMPKMIALWAAHTWCYDCFAFTPYLHIYSPDSNCGKSTLLKAAGKVSRKPWIPVAGSEAALYIKIEQDRPTVLLDEVDAIFHEKSNNEAMRAILNAGYERGGMVPRAPRGILQEYNVFGPKALAGIGQLPSTIENRAIHIFMQRQPPDSKAARWRTTLIDDETRAMREFFAAWGQDKSVTGALTLARPDMPPDLDGRCMDIIEPLLAIADLAGGDWPDTARTAALEAFVQVNGDSDNYKLLRDLRVIFEGHHEDTMTSHDIVENLVRMCEDAPWAQWWERAIKNDQYSAPQSRLAKMLKGYHIKPRNIRAVKYNEDEPEKVVLKGYHKADFTEAWKRFLPQAIKMENMTLRI